MKKGRKLPAMELLKMNNKEVITEITFGNLKPPYQTIGKVKVIGTQAKVYINDENGKPAIMTVTGVESNWVSFYEIAKEEKIPEFGFEIAKAVINKISDGRTPKFYTYSDLLKMDGKTVQCLMTVFKEDLEKRGMLNGMIGQALSNGSDGVGSSIEFGIRVDGNKVLLTAAGIPFPMKPICIDRDFGYCLDDKNVFYGFEEEEEDPREAIRQMLFGGKEAILKDPDFKAHLKNMLEQAVGKAPSPCNHDCAECTNECVDIPDEEENEDIISGDDLVDTIHAGIFEVGDRIRATKTGVIYEHKNGTMVDAEGDEMTLSVILGNDFELIAEEYLTMDEALKAAGPNGKIKHKRMEDFHTPAEVLGMLNTMGLGIAQEKAWKAQ